MIRILVTIGPSSLTENVLKEIDKERVYLFRINMSHTAIDKIEDAIKTIKNASDTPICIDSEGAQLRNNYMENENVLFKSGDNITIHFSEVIGNSKNISLNHVHGTKQLIAGDKICIDFKGVVIQVVEVKKGYIIAKVVRGGTVGSNKAVNVNKKINLPAITEKDKIAINIAKKMGVSNFALSFSSSMKDVNDFRKLSGTDMKIISKIESFRGLMNLDEIIKASDEILIDRGDLSREVAIEKIPFLQRNIVTHAKSLKKPVYVATNLLESMISFNEPNRAEVNDIISTLQMGTNGLVLAGETAVGEYPVECVKMIRRLIHQYNQWNPNSKIEDILNSSCLDAQ